ncbi:MAG: sodium:solute symporter family protein, partial [Pseudomonadota bacterium]
MAVIYLSPIDFAVVGLYFGATLLIGVKLQKGNQQVGEFLLAGRNLTLPLYIGSLVATWYGGILGVGEIAYRDGLVTWLTQGGFWYVSYLIFAFFW